MAGLWETWRSPAGERIRSFTIVTTKPNELCAELHNRMPVVLKPDVWPVWLGEQPADVPQLKALPIGAPAAMRTIQLAALTIGGAASVGRREAGQVPTDQVERIVL